MKAFLLKKISLFGCTFILVSPALAQEMHKVTQVVDGDTLNLDSGETVVLLGVQAPTFPPPGKQDKLKTGWAQQAKDYTSSLVLGQAVWLEYDKVRQNSAGQTLAYVFFKLGPGGSPGGSSGLLSGGTYMLNRLLLINGFATSGGDYPVQYRAEFNQLEAQARRSQRGLFQGVF